MTAIPHMLLCQYRYDPLDRLTGHVLAGTAERQRFYCKSRLATEIQGALCFSIIQHDGQLLAQQQSEGDLIGTALLVTGQERSVLNALKKDNHQQPSTYSPYGHSRFENGLLSLLGFNGERPDPVTGYYLLGNGYRAYNPVLKRFNSPDSWSPFGKGGLNAYAYCSGDPVNHTDPTGHTRNITGLILNQLRHRGKSSQKIVQESVLTESFASYTPSRSVGSGKISYKQSEELLEESQKTLLNAEIHKEYDLVSKSSDPKVYNGERSWLLSGTVNDGTKGREYEVLLAYAQYGNSSKADRLSSLSAVKEFPESVRSLEYHFELKKIEAKKLLKELDSKILSIRTEGNLKQKKQL